MILFREYTNDDNDEYNDNESFTFSITIHLIHSIILKYIYYND